MALLRWHIADIPVRIDGSIDCQRFPRFDFTIPGLRQKPRKIISYFNLTRNENYKFSIFAQTYLYLGLALMCGFVLYDTQLIIEKCRRGDRDFILHSVDLFVDLLGIFRRLVIILAQKVGYIFCFFEISNANSYPTYN